MRLQEVLNDVSDLNKRKLYTIDSSLRDDMT